MRGRYPDLPAAREDELAGKGRLFEAVVRLLDALARSAPLVLLLEDLHRVDGASLDLLRYLAHSWKEQGRRVLLLSTMRSEGPELSPQLATHLADLGRDVPLTQVTLQPLSQAQTMHLLEAMVGEGEPGTSTGEKQRDLDSTQPAPGWRGAAPAPERETPLLRLGDFLFAQTGGQPMYLLETLKLLRERQLLVPRLAADGRWRLEPTVEMSVAVVQEGACRELLPPSVRAMIQARLARLSPAARQVVMAAAVLATPASARRLWQIAQLGVQAGVEALEEAIKSGILREEEARPGRSAHYRFTHELMREVVYTELGAARRQVLHQQALAVLPSEGARASELAYHARASGQAQEACRYSVQAGDEAVAVFAVDDAIRHYEQGRSLLQEHPPGQSVLEAWEVECLYTHLGQAYAFQSAWEKAQQVYEVLIAYGRQHQLPTMVSLTLNRLAILAVQQAKDQSQVRALLEEARRTAQTSHDQRVLAETEWSLAQITAIWWGNPKCAFPHGVQALELARASNDKELEARSLYSLGGIHLFEGDFEEAIHCLEASLVLYAALSNEPTASWDLSLPSLVVGAPPTHSLTLGAREAFFWGMLALAQVQAGQVQASIRSSRRALALAKENQNVWAHVSSLAILTFGLLEVGAYEEAFVLMHTALELARTLPQMVIFQLFVHALGSTYHTLQQWEEASRTLAEAEAVAERLDLRLTRASVLSKLCMHYALMGQWEAAYRYAVEASTLRKNADLRLILLDFSLHYEIEAFLHRGDERQAREAVQRLGEQVEPYPRFRLPYLRSRAVLAEWEGDNEQAIGHWHEAAGLAADLGLPAEQWQIQAALGRVYEVSGQHVQARAAFGEAVRIIQGLAQDIEDEARHAHFLASPPIHQVLQHAHWVSSST
ncbi:MAG: hypothetical protein E6J22_04840 [Chloroflexi bacterium]|nr:MAG: hypothetical protein E6J22_04840 [Chloroflexota bacterium]